MTGYNLPPGVNVSDIPGNRPEDLAEEAWWDKLIELAPDDHLPADWWEDEGICALVGIVRDLAYTQGYKQGRRRASRE